MEKVQKDKQIRVDRIIVRRSSFFLLLRLFLLLLIFSLRDLVFNVVNFLLMRNLMVEDLFLYRLFSQFIFFLAFLVLSLIILLKWRHEYYEILKKAIIHHKGFLFKHKNVFTCSNIELIQFKQGIFGKIFNFGTIEMHDSFLNKTIYLMNIPNPNKYLELLRKMFLRVRSRSTST